MATRRPCKVNINISCIMHWKKQQKGLFFMDTVVDKEILKTKDLTSDTNVQQMQKRTKNK